jgi:hypothetical protein
MPDETWTCPSCAAKIPFSQRQCPSCRVTRIHGVSESPPRGTPAVTPAKKEEQEIMLPCFLPEARYSIVVPGGGAATWTSGIVYITTAGYFFLSEKDGFDSEAKAAEVAKEPSDVPKRLSPLSVFVPVTTVTRLVHGQFVGHFLEMTNLKIPLRLQNENWTRIVGATKKLLIKVDT